jgi:hypothetical protein
MALFAHAPALRHATGKSLPPRQQVQISSSLMAA